MEHKCKKTDLKTVEKCNLNAEQIKKAMECCSKDDCDNCPNDFGNCYSNLAGYALSLITSQEQKIFELENRLKECENGYEGTLHLESCKLHDAEEKVKELTAKITKWEEECDLRGDMWCKLNEENKRLTEENEKLSQSLANSKSILANSKADTVRQMQSEIKERCIKGGIYPAFVASTIDQIAEEIIGDAKQ